MMTLPPSPSFRHFRVRTLGGWRKAKHHLRNVDDLVDFMEAVDAQDTYYSTSLWLTPYDVADKHHAPLLLGTDAAFDLDAPKPITPTSLNVARRAALWFAKAMEDEQPTYQLQPDYPAWTGYKGYRLVYTDTDPGLPPLPDHRLPYIKARRLALLKRLYARALCELSVTQRLQYFRCLDTNVLLNPLSVIRVLGTTHSKTHQSSHTLTFAQLHNKPHNTHLWEVSANHTAVVMTGPDTPPPPWECPQPQVHTVVGSASETPDPTLFLTNLVPGHPDHYVLILPFYGTQTPHTITKAWTKTYAKTYGPLFILETPTTRYGLCLCVFQHTELLNLLDALHSPAATAFRRRRRLLAPFPTHYVGHLGKLHYPNRGHSESHAALLPPDLVKNLPNITHTTGLPMTLAQT